MRSVRLCGAKLPECGFDLCSGTVALRIFAAQGGWPRDGRGYGEGRPAWFDGAGPRSEAMSASGALNRPLRSPSGRTPPRPHARLRPELGRTSSKPTRRLVQTELGRLHSFNPGGE